MTPRIFAEKVDKKLVTYPLVHIFGGLPGLDTVLSCSGHAHTRTFIMMMHEDSLYSPNFSITVNLRW